MLSFFPRDVLDEIWDLIESVSEGFPTYSCIQPYCTQKGQICIPPYALRMADIVYNPNAPRKAKIVYKFGLSECNMVINRSISFTLVDFYTPPPTTHKL